MAVSRTARIARQPYEFVDGSGLRRLSGPAVVLANPKYLANLAEMIRNCAVFGLNTLCWTGDRIQVPTGKKADRLPREERMRDYETVRVINNDFPLHLFKADIVPVAVELLPGAVPLPYFEHPDNAVYVFGPEDGSIPTGLRAMCHHFVRIPSLHCLNLAQAGGITLYDRQVKRAAAGKDDLFTPGGHRAYAEDRQESA